MTRTRLLATGIMGFLVSMLGCVTPVLVGLLAVLGDSGSVGWLDYVLLPAMAAFAGLTAYALIRRKRVQRVRLSSPLRYNQPNSAADANAPANCATMNAAAFSGAIPANAAVRDRAIVTAGFANDVDDVNQ